MMQRFLLLLSVVFVFALAGCGVYSFTGASIQGKSINIHVLENRARNIVPSLSPSLTTKIRSRILSQTGLAPVKTDDADYDLAGTITAYEVTVSGVENTQQATTNRLTITVNIVFKNRLDKKADFTQSFTRFADFSANRTVQQAEGQLIEEIGNQLADDIFNKAFVNW
ncbi:MAG: hypothetical protein K0R82_1420 [Flavipsychrobacter sp.]|nr:hypothetical protein [Flavipsychrobacter sp.]